MTKTRKDIEDDIYMIISEADEIALLTDKDIKQDDSYIKLMQSFASLISSLHKFKNKLPE